MTFDFTLNTPNTPRSNKYVVCDIFLFTSDNSPTHKILRNLILLSYEITSCSDEESGVS